MDEKPISAYYRPMEEVVAQAKNIGAEIPNCHSCSYCSTDDDGSDYPSHSWRICARGGFSHPVCNLKSFPFKKPMRCWEPDFWQSRFPDLIQNGSDEEMLDIINQYRAAAGWALINSYGEANVQQLSGITK
ncbi:MAG: hypothetical protein GY861_28085 [bacterium]|nr:hypothetical protein [bacterium]